jgi:hypothetical protein
LDAVSVRTILARRKQAGNENGHHQRCSNPGDDERATSREWTATSLRKKNGAKVQPCDYQQNGAAKLTNVVHRRSHGYVADLYK